MIEFANESDGPAILDLTATVSVFSDVEVQCVDELWTAFREKGRDSGYVFIAYRDQDRLLGYACYGPHPLTEGTYDLYWIATDPAAQGRGIGRALLSRVEGEVQAAGSRLLVIETSARPPYAPARRLYEACGYQLEAVVHDFYAPGDHMLIFSKHLAPPDFGSLPASRCQAPWTSLAPRTPEEN